MNNIIWLYSGVISGWWCYDKTLNSKLSKMYVKYCKQKSIDCSDFVTVNMKTNYEKTDDFVNFNSENCQSDSDDDKNTQYIIRTTHGDYMIDFNKMIQQNLHDMSKKRNMKYIVIPQNILTNKNELEEYLSEKSVKGISGLADSYS